MYVSAAAAGGAMVSGRRRRRRGGVAAAAGGGGDGGWRVTVTVTVTVAGDGDGDGGRWRRQGVDRLVDDAEWWAGGLISSLSVSIQSPSDDGRTVRCQGVIYLATDRPTRRALRLQLDVTARDEVTADR